MNRKGFTLVELVVAIAALALCSGFIITMYFKSDELSDDANLYDEAMNQVSFISETFKASESPENFVENIHFAPNEASGKSTWTIYYNENWYAEDSLDNAHVVLFVELAPIKNYDSGTLYSLKLDFFEIKNDSQENVISLESKKYFPGVLYED
jgi:prepilin-type N-terminal cleavage/methylation domain-containing protein